MQRASRSVSHIGRPAAAGLGALIGCEMTERVLRVRDVGAVVVGAAFRAFLDEGLALPVVS